MKEKRLKKEVICILGMHRSGTSMISRLLNICGLYLGEKEELMVELDLRSNRKGHWEHREILAINDEILSIFGGSWDDPPTFPDGWENDPRLDTLFVQANVLVKRMSDRSLVWGFKEPRTCLTLPFWKRVIPGMTYVIPIRSMFEIAQSLYKRDNFALARGIFLCVIYWESILKNTNGERRIFTLQRDYFVDWSRELGRVLDFIGCKDFSFLGKEGLVGEFISPDLFHNRAENLVSFQEARNILPKVVKENIILRKELEERYLEIKAKDSTIEARDLEIKAKDSTIEARDLEIKEVKEEVQLVKSSKFWKLREQYTTLKSRLFGL